MPKRKEVNIENGQRSRRPKKMGIWAPQAECYGGSQWGPMICVGRKNLGLDCSECRGAERGRGPDFLQNGEKNPRNQSLCEWMSPWESLVVSGNKGTTRPWWSLEIHEWLCKQCFPDGCAMKRIWTGICFICGSCRGWILPGKKWASLKTVPESILVAS